MTPAEALGAWQELRSRLAPYVARRVASASDADDVLQEVSIRMLESLAQLRDRERFSHWVRRIAERAIADHGRMRARHPVRPAPTERAEHAGEEPSDADALLPALTECVALFVAQLPTPYREAVSLTELEGLSQKAAAELLGISLSGLKSRVQRGRQKLRALFEACCELSLDGRGRVVDARYRAGPACGSSADAGCGCPTQRVERRWSS